MGFSIDNNNGFSLIELMVVIALIGILSAIASLSMDLVRKERLASAAKELLADIQKTRVDAMVSGQSSNFMTGAGIRFSDPFHDYVVFNFNDANGDFVYSGTAEETGARGRDINASLTLEVAASSDSTYNVLLYNRMGLPSRFKQAGSDAGNGNMVLLLKETSINITKCVKVEINRIREGAWDETTSTCNEQ